MTTLLKATNLTMRFDGITAVSQLDLDLARSRITALIGPNGAGKTTVFNLLTGIYAPTEGQILFEDSSITGLRPWTICRRGVARTFQSIRLFKTLSVLDNVRIALDGRAPGDLAAAMLGLKRARDADRARAGQAQALLDSFKLGDRASAPAGSLAYGAQRRLEIARAIATGARLLLLDEPAAGLNSQETIALMELIARVRAEYGTTILLIEHDMKLVMGVSEHVVVLDHGVKIAEGPPDVVRSDPKVIEAYLGRARG